MKKEKVFFKGKMKGQAFNSLEQTYLGTPVLLASNKNKQQPKQKIFFRTEPQVSTINIRKQNIISAMIEIQTKDARRKNVDLLCLLDISASMGGKKIQQVKQTMKVLILGRDGKEFLQENDRLCVVLFNHGAATLFDFTNTNSKNKKSMVQEIEKIQSSGGTSFNAGLTQAFEKIKNRQNKNDILSVFLLSDGQNYDEQNSIEVLKELSHESSDDLSIHTFGFGSDYDVKLMTEIAQQTKGQTIAVTDINDVQQEFQKFFKKVAHTVGTGLTLCLKKISTKYLQKATIQNTYGNNKLVSLNETTYHVKIPQLYSNLKKSFVFEIKIPEILDQIEKEKIEEAIFECTVTGNGIQETKASILKFTITTQQVTDNNYNPGVVENNYRIKIVSSFEEISSKADGEKYTEAEKLIDSLLTSIQKDHRVREEKKVILQKELQNMKEHCKNWKKDGRKKAIAMVASLDSRGI